MQQLQLQLLLHSSSSLRGKVKQLLSISRKNPCRGSRIGQSDICLVLRIMIHDISIWPRCITLWWSKTLCHAVVQGKPISVPGFDPQSAEPGGLTAAETAPADGLPSPHSDMNMASSAPATDMPSVEQASSVSLPLPHPPLPSPPQSPCRPLFMLLTCALRLRLAFRYELHMWPLQGC